MNYRTIAFIIEDSSEKLAKIFRNGINIGGYTKDTRRKVIELCRFKKSINRMFWLLKKDSEWFLDSLISGFIKNVENLYGEIFIVWYNNLLESPHKCGLLAY